jgi:hypothetical protein
MLQNYIIFFWKPSFEAGFSLNDLSEFYVHQTEYFENLPGNQYSVNIFFTLNNHKGVNIHRNISIFITKPVRFSGFGDIFIGEI